MPKQKSHKGAQERFKVTRTGKVRHRRQNRNHLLEGKPARRKRRLARDGQLTGGDAAQVKRLKGLR
jgi:large subunit ribosomal protein L35